MEGEEISYVGFPMVTSNFSPEPFSRSYPYIFRVGQAHVFPIDDTSDDGKAVIY